MWDWEVCESNAGRSNAIIDKADPEAPAPCCPRGRQKLRIHHVGSEWKNEERHDAEIETSLVHRYQFGCSMIAVSKVFKKSGL